MKKILSILLVIFITNIQAQNWLWSKSQHISSGGYAGNVKLGASGNLLSYLANSNSTHLIFSNANGDTIWKKYIPNFLIRDAYLDANDNIFFAGVFTNSMTISGNTFVSAGGNDAVIGKLNSTGTLVQSKTFGTANNEGALSIAALNNDFVISGFVNSTQMVDAVALTTSTANTTEAYVLKLSQTFAATAGSITSSFGSGSGALGQKVAVDQSGNIYLLGVGASPCKIGNDTIWTYDDGTFLIKFNSSLQKTWSKVVSSHWSNGQYRASVHFDSNSNLILSKKDSGGGSGNNVLGVEKYNSAGNLLWSQWVNVNESYCTDMDAQDNVWAVGKFYPFNGPAVLSVVKINPSGLKTTVISDSTMTHYIKGLAVQGNIGFYIIGDCNPNASLNGYTCSPQGSLFMAKYGTGVTTSVSEKHLSQSVVIFPNPTTGVIKIKANEQILRVVIKDLLGKVLYAQSSNQMNLDNLPKGMYLVEVNTEGSKVVEKIILE